MSVFKKEEQAAATNGSLKDTSAYSVSKTGGEVDSQTMQHTRTTQPLCNRLWLPLLTATTFHVLCRLVSSMCAADLVSALLPHSLDKDAAVRSAYECTLIDLGNRQPALLLSALATFLHKNPKLELPHRIQLLTLIERITTLQREHITAALSGDLIRFLTHELIKDVDKNVEPVNETAQPCNTTLTALALAFPNPLLDHLLSHLKHGEVAPYWLVKTLSDVAVANPAAFVGRLSEVMVSTTPSLAMVKKPAMRWVMATALGHYAEALQHYKANTAQHDNHSTTTTTTSPQSEASTTTSTTTLEGEPSPPSTITTTTPTTTTPTTTTQLDPSAATAIANIKSFELEFLSAFDILFNRWLTDSPDLKVRLTILEALGSIATCLDRQQLETRLPKVLPKYLETYKKEKPLDQLPVSVGLYHMLASACQYEKVVEVHLPQLLPALHQLVCRPVDVREVGSVKNHNELLRIFELLARSELDATLAFVVNRFQLKEKEVKIGSLIVLRHYVNAMDERLIDKRPLIMSSVLTMVGESDMNVKRAMMQLIVSMSNHGYLEMEGGQALVKFIINQCALPVEANAAGGGGGSDSKAASEDASPLQLRNAGNHILYVMATRVPSCHPVLWPYLVELLNDDHYTRAILVILRCIDALATTKRAEAADDYRIDFELKQDIPRPQAILARLMCLLAEPLRHGIGPVVCRCMLALGPLIHPAVGEYWDESVGGLIEYLDAHSSDTLDVRKWQDSLLKLWRETINRIKDQKWLQELVDKLMAQFPLYRTHTAPPHNDSSIHKQLHRYIGYTLSRLESKAIVERTIDATWSIVNHRVDTERTGYAQSMGWTSYTHIDTVLVKLSERLKQKEKKTGFFANLLDKDDGGIGDEVQHSTAVLCFGYVAATAQPELLLSRMDVYMLHNMLPIMGKARTHLFRLSCALSLELMGRSVQAERLPEGKLNYRLTQRDDIVTHLIAYMDERANKQRVSAEMRSQGLLTLVPLVRLAPPLTPELRTKLLLAVLPYYGLSDATMADDNKQRRAEEEKEQLEWRERRDEVTVDAVQTNLNTLLSTLITADPLLATTLDTLKLLEPYLVSVRVMERQRAATSFLTVLKELVGCLTGEGRRRQDEKAIAQLGSYISMVLPRICDSDREVRERSVENVQALLYVDQLLHNPDNPKPSADIKLIKDVRERIESSNYHTRLPAADDLTAILVTLLPVAEVVRLLEGLFPALLDADGEAAIGAAYCLWRLIERQGRQMKDEVKVLVAGVLTTARQCRNHVALEYVWCGVRLLTLLHFSQVVTQLLDTPPALLKEYVDVLTAIATDPATSPVLSAASSTTASSAFTATDTSTLPVQFVEHLLALLNDTPIDKDKPSTTVATATAALKEVCRVPSLRPLVIPSHYAAMFATILMRIGVANEVDTPAAATDAVSCLKSFLTLSNDLDMVAELDAAGVWRRLEGAGYDDGMTLMCRSMCVHHAECKVGLLGYLGKFFSLQSYAGQRIVATSLLAELVTHSASVQSGEHGSVAAAGGVAGGGGSGGGSSLLKDVIRYLLPRVADKLDKVRKHALRGLGNLVTVWTTETADMATSILSSLMSASEDPDSEVAGEAVASLTRIVAHVEVRTIEPMLISLCFRLRPAFDRKETNVRSSAFTLFGGLCRFGSVDGLENRDFSDQLHQFLPIYLVHLHEDDGIVRLAVHDGLKQLAALLDPQIQAIVADSSTEPSQYDDLIHRLAPLLSSLYPQHVRGYLDTCVTYFTSGWQPLRGASALLACVVLASATSEVRKGVVVSGLIAALVKLLDEGNGGVRAKVVKGMAYLYDV